MERKLRRNRKKKKRKRPLEWQGTGGHARAPDRPKAQPWRRNKWGNGKWGIDSRWITNNRGKWQGQPHRALKKGVSVSVWSSMRGKNSDYIPDHMNNRANRPTCGSRKRDMVDLWRKRRWAKVACARCRRKNWLVHELTKLRSYDDTTNELW